MLIPFSNLKDFALLLSNVLRDFAPETMFWHPDNPILFPNYDNNGFIPCQTMRKPFSVQIILESFSRSCGYKSYNALLADRNRLDVLDVDLIDLNPVPRNPYFTALWVCFINEMCKSVYVGYTNQAIPSYLTYRNFKPHNFQHLIPFMGWGLEVILKPNKKAGREIEFLESYYPIALSMLFTALEIGLEKIQVADKKRSKVRSSKARFNSDSQDDDIYFWQLNRVPLKKFLIHQQWQDSNFLQFKNSLTLSMSFLFDTTLKFEDQGDDPLNSLVTLTSPVDIASLAERAMNLFRTFVGLREWAVKQCAQITDQRYYTSIDHKAISTLNSSYVPKEFAWAIEHQLSLNENNISKCAIYGTKAFWINQGWHTVKNDRMLTELSNDKLENHILNFIQYHLRPFKKPVEISYPLEYCFEIQGVDQFVKNSNGLVKTQDIPKKILIRDGFSVVFGEQELDLMKLAIHSQIMAILPRDSYDFEMHSKRMGNPGIIQFDPVKNNLKTPKLKIKAIEYNSATVFDAAKADLVFNFELPHLIHSICIERIPDNLINSQLLKPYEQAIEDRYDYFNFIQGNSSFDDFMFTTDHRDQKYYCMLNIALFDTPYNVGLDLDPMNGWSQFSVLCSIDSLDFDNYPKFELSLCYSEEDKTHKKRLGALQLIVDALNGDTNMDISTLIKNCLYDSRLQWNDHKIFIEGQGAENSNLDTLYQFITHHPHSIEYI